MISIGQDGKHPSLLGHALNTREAFYTNEPLKHGSTKDISKEQITQKNFLSVPVIVGDELVGQIALANSSRGHTNRDLEAISRTVNIYGLSTMQVRAYKDLQASEKSLEKAQLLALIGNFEYEIETGSVVWSSQLYMLFDYRPNSMAPTIKTVEGHVHPDDLEIYNQWWHSTINKGSWTECEFRIRRKSVEIRWLHVQSHMRFDDQNQPVKVYGTAQDITERMEQEKHRMDLAAQIQHGQKLESLGVLAGGIAHDFNNLLAGTLGNASLALDEVASASPAAISLNEIHNSARRAADLTRQMLAYFGKGKFEVLQVLLNEVIKDTTSLLSLSISKKARLKYKFAEGLPMIKADETQLRQVVMNLITNASESLVNGSGDIELCTSVVGCNKDYFNNLTLVPENMVMGDYICLEVCDTDCGMDEETKNKVFDPFFTTKFTGWGLGIAAVLGITRGHDWALSLISYPGAGFCFKVYLPVSQQTTSQQDANNIDEPVLKVDGSILLVDDEPVIRQLGERMLKKLGISVLLAEDGQSAVDLYKQHTAKISLVILDLTMPNMSGDEAFKALKEINGEVRILISSGFAEENVLTDYNISPNGFLPKPFTKQEVEKKIAMALS